MLAYYLTWHLKAAWKPLLFTDEDRPTNPDPVAKAVRSPGAQHKAQTKRTTTGEPAHSYQRLSRAVPRLSGDAPPCMGVAPTAQAWRMAETVYRHSRPASPDDRLTATA